MKIGNLVILVLVVLSVFSIGSGQVRSESDAVKQVEGSSIGRPNLLRELGLSSEQLQQVRFLNQERRPLMEHAQLNFRTAMSALDAAIYADAVNDDEVAARIRDVQTAQAEVARLRFNNELSLRKILTPDQLMKFRDLRRQFNDRREELGHRRMNRNRRFPLQQMRKLYRQPKTEQ